jgi:hypothetical protein|tara:strand:- start:401 stop:595 length:195 start_codon:yes stop_codon:yes gene_type:complete
MDTLTDKEKAKKAKQAYEQKLKDAGFVQFLLTKVKPEVKEKFMRVRDSKGMTSGEFLEKLLKKV